MIKIIAIISLICLSDRVAATNYFVNVGTYLSATPTSGFACKAPSTATLVFSSSYFTSVGKTYSYFYNQNFAATDDSTGIKDTSGGLVYANTISADSYTGLENGNFFKFGPSTTRFVLTYATGTFYDAKVTTYSPSLTTYSPKDLFTFTYSINVAKSAITVTSASTASNVVNSTTCLTINMNNPCVYLVPTTTFRVTLPTTADPNNPGSNITPLSAFNASTCNVQLNGQTTTSQACSVSGDVLTITGLVSSYMSNSTLALSICSIKRASTTSGSKIEFLNSSYTSPSNLYADSSFSY